VFLGTRPGGGGGGGVGVGRGRPGQGGGGGGGAQRASVAAARETGNVQRRLGGAGAAVADGTGTAGGGVRARRGGGGPAAQSLREMRPGDVVPHPRAGRDGRLAGRRPGRRRAGGRRCLKSAQRDRP